MVDYDPYDDPRHIPSETEIPVAQRMEIEDEIELLSQNIELFDSVLLMFQHPGWTVLDNGFKRVVDELDTLLRKEHDPSSWKFYRGQLAQVEWFQTLPDEMADRQRRLRRDQAELLRMLGRE